MSQTLTLADVASMFGHKLQPLGKRSFCPFRKHLRKDPTFRTFVSKKDGQTQLYKCWSCDPPSNVGDVVSFYGMLAGIDRKEAWHELRKKGYQVPGARFEARTNLRKTRVVIPIEGDKPKPDAVLPLDLGLWRKWHDQRLGAVERFAEQRQLDPVALRRMDVVDVDRNTIGFGYRDPDTGLPCRVKVRPIDRKAFWMEPKAPDGVRAKALAPLYLAHAIQYDPTGIGTVMVVTEGEVDALTLRALGIKNAVSLPDGSSSAAKVDLSPIWTGVSLVLSAVDADDEGTRAHLDLFRRTSQMHINIGRVYWRDGATTFKDANDALKAGFGREQFLSCLQQAADETLGFTANLASAC